MSTQMNTRFERFKWSFKNLPSPPPSPLRRWFVQFDGAGPLWITLLIGLSLITYLQLDRQPGTALAIFRVIWAGYALTAVCAFLIALDLTARYYERTTGRAYRERDDALQLAASQAERDALSSAEAALLHRELDLAERERNYSDRLHRLRKEQHELHAAELSLLSRRSEARAEAQAACSGKQRRKKPNNSNSTSFKDLGIP